MTSMNEPPDWAGWLALMLVVLGLGGALIVIGLRLAEVPQ